MSVADFEYTTNLLQEIPNDTVFYAPNNESQFLQVALTLWRRGHVFVASANAGQIAMSQVAARSIGLL